MLAPLTTDRQKYYYLMSLVCEDLQGATRAIDFMIRSGHVATSAQLTAVRVGRSPNLAWLIDLVRECLPQFSIPEEVLPAATAAKASPAMSLGL